MAVDPSPYLHDGVPVAQLLSDLADAARDAMAATPDGIPTVYGVYHGDPVEDCCDAIQLWVREWVPVVPGQFPQTASEVDRCKQVDFCPRVTLALRRPCAEIPDGQGEVSAAEEMAVAMSLIIDIRALMCGVKSTWPGLVDDCYPGKQIMFGAPQSTSTASCYGWDWDILVGVKDCAC